MRARWRLRSSRRGLDPVLNPLPDLVPDPVWDDLSAADGTPVAQLLAEVAALRRALELDLTAAAAASDADRPDLAADLVAGVTADRSAFAELARRAALARPRLPGREGREGRLGRLGPVPRRLTAAAMVALSLAAGMATADAAPRAHAPAPTAAWSAQVRTQLAALRKVAAEDDPAGISVVAAQIADSLANLLTATHGDPVALAQAVAVLQTEQNLITPTDPQLWQALVGANAALLAQLRAGGESVAAQILAAVPAVGASAAPLLAPSTSPLTTPRPAAGPGRPDPAAAPAGPGPMPTPSPAATHRPTPASSGTPAAPAGTGPPSTPQPDLGLPTAPPTASSRPTEPARPYDSRQAWDPWPGRQPAS